MRTAIILIVLATLYRLLPTVDLSLSNFSPVMAIGFCGAVYFRNRWMWLIPFAILVARPIARGLHRLMCLSGALSANAVST